MSPLQKIVTEKAPAAIGPYSQAVKAGDFVYVSGQVPIDPATGALVPGDVVMQAEQVLKNIAVILDQAGLSMDRVVKAEVYLADIANFGAVNEVYARHFTAEPKPARQAMQVGALPLGALVEISCIAFAG